MNMTAYEPASPGLVRVESNDTDFLSIMGYAQPTTHKPMKLTLVKPRRKNEYHLNMVNGTKLGRQPPSFILPITKGQTANQHRPDLVMHNNGGTVQELRAARSAARANPAVACAYMAVGAGADAKKHLKVGLGDASTSLDTVEWEDMEQTTARASHFRWAMDLGRGENEWRRPTEFVWKRTTRVAVDGVGLNRFRHCNYKLVEATSGSRSNTSSTTGFSTDGEGGDMGGGSGAGDKVLAVFTEQSGFARCGTLQVNVDLGDDFYHMVLVTSVALYERRKRKR